MSHKRSLSLTELDPAEAEAMLLMLENVHETLKTGRDRNVDNVIELELLQETIKESVDALKALKMKREEYNQDKLKISSISFSRMTAEHYDRLAITPPLSHLNATDFTGLLGKLKLRLPYNQQKILKDIPLTGLLSLWTKLKNKQINERSEMCSRMILDQFHYQLMDACKASDLCILLVPEMNISPHKNPVDIRTRESLTTLTGLADYFTLCVQASQYVGPKNAAAQAQFTSAQNLHEFKNLFSHRPVFLVMEAKRIDTNLDLHVPQAIGQCLATAKILGVSKVTFCISTGMSWIFGVFDNSQSKESFVRTQVISTDLKNTEPSVLRTILAALYIWATMNAEDIMNELTSKDC